MKTEELLERKKRFIMKINSTYRIKKVATPLPWSHIKKQWFEIWESCMPPIESGEVSEEIFDIWREFDILNELHKRPGVK